ncbi:MAG: ABC transporter ATP-binding protein [Gemmataceae bacterium]
MIQVDNLTVRAGAFLLSGASLTVPKGQYGMLMGKTGCGKTTILEAICGLKPVQAGRVVLMGRDVTHLKPAERGVGYVPQDRALFASLTVEENLAFALTIRRWPTRAITRRVEELAELLRLERLLGRKPHGLSGGEAQRVALGRALAFDPHLLLLDEPLSALDEDTRAEMHDLLIAVRERTGVTVLHVTHNQSEARKLADVVFTLKGGAVHAARNEDGFNGDAACHSLSH